jgi:hypothetical protein
MGIKKVCAFLSELKSTLEMHAAILQLIAKVETMSTALDALTAEVSQNSDVINSAITLITGLKAKIDELIAAGNVDPALQALSDSLDSKTNELAAAVAANTPTP